MTGTADTDRMGRPWTPASLRQALGKTGPLQGLVKQNLGHAIIRVANDAETQELGGEIAKSAGEGGIFITQAALDAAAAGFMLTEAAEEIRQGLSDSVLVINSPQELHEMLGLTPMLIEQLAIWQPNDPSGGLRRSVDGTSSLDEQRRALIEAARALGYDVTPRGETDDA